MKIWGGFGTEHSMNLVMIGHFKNADDAENTKQLIDRLTEGLKDKIDIGTSGDRYSDGVLELLRELNCNSLGPAELEQFLYDINTKLETDKIIVTTDEFDISAFLKLMINNGARVEVYSAHDFPDSELGQGE